MDYSRRVDLTNCDREPIHVPGSIQPHGCLLACDTAGGTVLRHSANAEALLGIAGDPNGKLLDEVLGAEAAHAVGTDRDRDRRARAAAHACR